MLKKVIAFSKVLSRKVKLLKNSLKQNIKSYKSEENAFASQIHKRLYDVSQRPVISNCGTLTEKASEFLDNHLKEDKQNGWSYIKEISRTGGLILRTPMIL